MKRFLVIILVISGLWLYGQDDSQEFKTIFGSNHSSGGYGAPELKLGNVNGEISLLVGGRGGWVIGNKFVLGGAGYGLTTNNTFSYTEDILDGNENLTNDSTRTLNIDMGYGGILLEYIAMPKNAIHLSFPLIIGAGGTSVSAKTLQELDNVNPQEWTKYDFVESSAFFVVEPGINVELNMTKFFRLGMGASYRFISGTNLVRLSSNDLSDLSFNLTLKFGKF
ncbi:MAG: hypothetical protein K8S16_05080 [Bacteroidales bacterium]|nr:hypothetical protein [Bacteroidales bacterium]